MPEVHSLIDVPQPVLGQDEEYKEVTGREIFEELSITGLNRSPIETLTSLISADSELNQAPAVTDWPEIPLAVICEYVLVDGSFAVRYTGDKKADEPYVFLKDCVEIHKTKIVQQLRNERGLLSEIVRVYEKGEKNWTVKDIRNYEKPDAQIQKTEKYPVALLIAYPYGQGLLYWNQKTYRRLEEIEQSIRQQTGPASLSMIITGFAGSVTQARSTFGKGPKIVGIPGNVTVHRVASNTTADQLMSNSEGLLTKYYKNMHLVEVSETSTMSGRSRKIAMMPMLSYVESIRAVLDEVYELLGYEVSWGGIDVLETAELISQLDFLKRGRDEGHLDDQEYRRKVRALYGLTEDSGRVIEPVGDE